MFPFFAMGESRMRRRSLIKGFGAAGLGLAAPSIVAAQGARVLKFIPHADLTVLDPIWTTAYVTRNHGYLVYDTLFGMDNAFKASPQMAEGMTVENDGKLVRITLRDGLKFHDGEKVLARDCVASIRRWGARDTFGQSLLAATDELSAADDKTIQFKLKRAFPLLADALAKAPSNFAAMMPERLAKTDPFTQITEVVGSGPFKFVARERNAGHIVVYERFADYVPRAAGTPDGTAGPKVAHFDRVEWRIIPDPGTAAAALQSGEVDWWESVSGDYRALLRRAGLNVATLDPTGSMGCMRLNFLQPPFNNPAARRALFTSLNQADFMEAASAGDPAMYTVPTGYFPPGTPMANSAGLEAIRAKPDHAATKAALLAAGYKGEKIVLLHATDLASVKILGDVAADMLKQAGLNVEVQAMDWGTVVQRRVKKDPVTQGGWNAACTYWSGQDHLTPAGHVFLRGTGERGGNWGWPESARLEELRDAWFAAPDLAGQQKAAAALQAQAFIDVPYVPLGQVRGMTAYRKNISGVLQGIPSFWNVQRVSA
jgi:peptide/nickel transport system substrate-binding protein